MVSVSKLELTGGILVLERIALEDEEAHEIIIVVLSPSRR